MIKNTNQANIRPHLSGISSSHRRRLNGHGACLVWLTGLSGSGKSTIAYAVETILYNKGYQSYVIDGDSLRQGISSDLSFSENDRSENIRRAGYVGRLFVDAGFIVLAALISPIKFDRMKVKNLFLEHEFIQIYCSAPISTCEGRDVKGLYRKARLGQIQDFTGIGSSYEMPDNSDLVIDTSNETIEHSANSVINLLINKQIIS